MDVILPALRFVSQMLTEHYPTWASYTSRYDVFYALLMFFLEGFHLKRNQATCTDYFYGLCLTPTKPKEVTSPLESVAHRRMADMFRLSFRQGLAFYVVALLPLIRLKAENNLSLENNHSRRNAVDRTRWKKMFLDWYPKVITTAGVASFGYQLLYLFDVTNYWTPLHHFLKLELHRKRPDPILPNQPRNIWSVLSFLAWTSIFGLQFMQWWFQREGILQPFEPKPAVPPPPIKMAYSRQTKVLLPKDMTLCPICHKKRNNPAASVGGFVFCYVCLLQYVEHNKQCPISGLSMTNEQIRRVYTA